MSLYIFNFTEDYAIAGADSRVCVSVDNGKTHYRWHDNIQKIHVVDNKIITVGGVEWAGSLALKKFKEYPNRSIERLRDIAKYITQNAEQIARSMGIKFVSKGDDQYFLELCVMTYEDGKNVAYHIANYKDFEIVRVESQKGILMNFFGGIHIDEAKLVYRQFVRNMDLVNVYKHMYEAVADEKCGGTLTLYEMKHGEIVKRHNYPIRDSRIINNIPDNIKAQYGINIIAQQGEFDGIKVYDSELSKDVIARDPSLYSDLIIAEIGRYRNDNGQDTRGIKLNNSCFEITSRNVPGIVNNGIIMNPTEGLIVTKSDNKIRSKFNATEGISIESSTNGTDWIKKFFVDTSGKLNLVDIKASGEIVANSLAATTKITVGNINLLDLVNNGINTLTGVINGSTIQTNTISASHIKTDELIVGTNVAMGSGAVITWDNLDAISKANLVGPAGSPGSNGVDANLLPWVSSWNSQQTLVGGEYIVTPKIFSGTSSGGVPTGVAMGNINGFNGIAGYNAGTRTFSVDATTGNVDITGSFKTLGPNNHTVLDDGYMALYGTVNSQDFNFTAFTSGYYSSSHQVGRIICNSCNGGYMRGLQINEEMIEMSQGTPLLIRPNCFSTSGGILPTPAYDLSKAYVGVEGGLSIGSNYYYNYSPLANGAIIEGTVGIGTSSPLSTAKLDVYGNARIDNANHTAALGINGVPGSSGYALNVAGYTWSSWFVTYNVKIWSDNGSYYRMLKVDDSTGRLKQSSNGTTWTDIL